jgi:hypothetical protein
VDDLQAPLWTDHHWRPRGATHAEASLAQGVRIEANFDDPDERLATAYDDLLAFLAAGGVASGDYIIETARIDTAVFETYRIEVAADRCRILAGDTEGIRRGIFHVEDLMRRAGGPLLPLGDIERTPIVRTRISRCFFGPIKRPPRNRDELADDVNYYPDEYLNRLAHDGINALWLSIKFSDLCRSRYFPEFGKDADRRLAKLNRTVEQCARYGIRIYAFCIEPCGFGDIAEYNTPRHMLEPHPDLAGHTTDHCTYFCTSSEKGQAYLEEATYALFSAVPNLGGLIDINLGERPTHCYSNLIFLAAGNNCPRCSKRSPGDVLADTLSAMARGMHRGNPDAELVAWLYTPAIFDGFGSTVDQRKAAIRDIAAKIPPQVTLQFNFESSDVAEQLGREHLVLDYSLAHVGPSATFAACAELATARGARMSAKLQVGNSHEVATIPFVPAPGNIYRKYRRMHELGVSTAMQCWYFGNYPSVMTRAAGRCSFAPLPKDENQLLHELATSNFPDHAATVADAWRHFRDAYAGFPVNLQFSWFGPVHDAIAWPLHLDRVDEPISPSWLLGWPPSGDRIGECFAFGHELDEILELTATMAATWDKGVRLLKGLAGLTPEQQLEVGVAEALGLQMRSAAAVMRFYALREQGDQLPAMLDIVRDEIVRSRRLRDLAAVDSRLGFHSEAEGYKYFPALLDWRVEQLESLLANPALPQPWDTTGPTVRCATGSLDDAASMPLGDIDASWRVARDDQNLYVHVSCPRGSHGEPTQVIGAGEHIAVVIEPRRLWPTHGFMVDPFGRTHHDDKTIIPDKRWSSVTVHTAGNRWEAHFTIPFVCLKREGFDGSPMRINVSRVVPGGPGGGEISSWIEHHPLRSRLLFGGDNPRDYGWLVFE